MKKKYILDSVGLYKGYLKFYTLETLSVSIIICSLFLHRTHNKSIKNSGFLSPITFNSKTEAIKLFLFSTTGRCSSKYPLLTSCNLSQSNMKCCNVSFSSLHNLHILADTVVEFHTTRYYWGLRGALYYVGIVQKRGFIIIY